MHGPRGYAPILSAWEVVAVRARVPVLLCLAVAMATVAVRHTVAAPVPPTRCRPAGAAVEVLVGGAVVMRLRSAGAEPDVTSRCARVVERLAGALEEVSAAGIVPAVVDGHAAVLAGTRLVVTPLDAEARANRTSPALLAWWWANRLRGALGAPALGLDAVPWRGLPGLRPVLASWYGYETRSRRTASGQPFNPRGHTAAHRRLPFGTLVRVIHPQTGRQVLAVINDRGPFVRGRELDLSYGAARELGMLRAGVAALYMEVVHPGDAR